MTALSIFLIIAAALLIPLIISFFDRNLRTFLWLLTVTILIAIGSFSLSRTWSINISRWLIGSIAAIIAITRGLIRASQKFTRVRKLLGWILSIFLALWLLMLLLGTNIFSHFIKRLTGEHKPPPPPPPPPIETGHVEEPVPIIGADCHLPRWGKIADQAYVYAFKNRTDTPSICDREIRICNNGFLNGQFQKPYCQYKKDHNSKTYTYQTHEPFVNPLIQPNQPSNNGPFDTRGKPIKQEEQITIEDLDYQEPLIPYTEKTKVREDCRAPRWELITENQFIQSYEAPLGTSEYPCRSEKRVCHKGKLSGKYNYPSCDVYETDIIQNKAPLPPQIEQYNLLIEKTIIGIQ